MKGLFYMIAFILAARKIMGSQILLKEEVIKSYLEGILIIEEHLLVIEGGVMFSAIIPKVSIPTCPIIAKLTLSFSAYEPVEAAVHCLEFSGHNGIIN